MEVLPTSSSPISFSTISRNVDDSISKVDSLLEESKNARNEFETQWTKLIKDIETDVSAIESELAKFPASLALFLELKERERSEAKKTRKKKAPKKNNPTSNHALYFHLMKQSNQVDGGVFLLPPENETEGRDDETIVSQTTKLTSGKRTQNAHNIDNKLKVEEQRKFDMREDIISKIEELRNLEISMITNMNAEHNEDDKEGTKDACKAIEVERQQIQGSQLMLKMISQYKPKVSSRRAKNMHVSRMVLKDTLNEAAKLIQDNPKKSKRDHEDSMIRDINNYKSIENLPLTTTTGSLKKIVSDATRSQEHKTNIVDNDVEKLTLNSDNYSEYDFESEDEEDYGSDSFET